MTELDVEYSFFDRPVHISPSPKSVQDVDVDNEDSEELEPSSELLRKIAVKLSPLKRKRSSPRRRSDPWKKSPRSPRRSKKR